MGRWIIAIIIGALAVSVFVLVNVRAGADSPVPTPLAPWLEQARDGARHDAGLVGLFPAQFVEARCSADGRTAVLAFESAIGSVGLVATIGFPPPEEWSAPGATVTIIGSDTSGTAELSAEACVQVPTGPTR